MRDIDIEYMLRQWHREQLLAEVEAERNARRLRRPGRVRAAIAVLLIALGRRLVRLGERLRQETPAAAAES